MNKRIAIPVVAGLLVGVILISGCVGGQQTDELKDALAEILGLEEEASALRDNISTLEGNISTLEANTSELQGDVSTLEAELAASDASASSFQADLQAANAEIAELRGDVETEQNLNLALSAELAKIKNPRHFESPSELMAWLQQDDTDTKYAGEHWTNLPYILQLRALRDGYLLPATAYILSDSLYIMNSAYVASSTEYASSIWRVYAESDEIVYLSFVQPLPSTPLPLE
jgi:peptidoglycan hydrolase CwlO-like protein